MKEMSEVLENLSDKLDAVLLRLIKTGIPLKDSKGNPILDADGKPILGPPSAAVLNVARQRLKDLGIDKMIVSGDPVEELAREVGLEDPDRLKFPDMPEGDDAASRVG